MSSLSLGLPEPLFGGPAPRLRAIPASEPFLDLLAEAMIAALKRDDADDPRGVEFVPMGSIVSMRGCNTFAIEAEFPFAVRAQHTFCCDPPARS